MLTLQVPSALLILCLQEELSPAKEVFLFAFDANIWSVEGMLSWITNLADVSIASKNSLA